MVSSSRVISFGNLAYSSACLNLGTKSPHSGVPPPSGRILDRLTSTHRKRLANPFANSVSVMNLSSSSFVMWPMMDMWALVALAGEFLVRIRRLPESHACLRMGDSVLPSLAFTFNTDANSVSTISNRLSDTPASMALTGPICSSPSQSVSTPASSSPQ